MNTRTILLALASAACLAGCATDSSYTTGTQQLTREFVEKSLIKGRTSKQDVLALLGEPQTVVSSDAAGGIPGIPYETWTYTKIFHRDATQKGGFAYAVAYSMANPASRGYDRVEVSVLMVMFDAKGRVASHTFSTSATGMPR